jgi:hypothetical protein
MHSGVLVGAAWGTVVLVVIGGFVVLGLDAGGDGCGDAHAVTPAHPTAMMVINRIAFDMDVLVILACILRRRWESIAL